MVMLYSYIRVPYNIAFEAPTPDNSFEQSVEIFIDLMILVDICCSFITDYYSTPGEAISNWSIAWKYASSYFVLDLISMSGLFWLERVEKFGMNHNYRYWLKLFRYTYMGRTFHKIDYIFRVWLHERAKHHAKNGRNVAKSGIRIALLMHIFACIYIFLGENPSANDPTISWSKQEENRYSNLNPDYLVTNIYVTAVYFVATTMTTVGYGDYVASTF
jgi:hypothetical protein